MKTNRPFHTNAARRQRILLWAGLWLAWAAEFLAGALTHFRATRQLTAPLREWLAYLARVIACCLLLQAAQRVAALPRSYANRYGPQLERAAVTRALIGRAVRKAMRASSLSAQVALLAAILRNPERIVRMLAERLETGLTRLERHLIARENLAACAPFAVMPRAADTS